MIEVEVDPHVYPECMILASRYQRFIFILQVKFKWRITHHECSYHSSSGLDSGGCCNT